MENEPLNTTEKIKMAVLIILPSLLILTVLSFAILTINKRTSGQMNCPEMTIKAPETIEIEQGEKFKITSYVTIKEGNKKLILKTYGDVDTSKPGDYDITVSATGSSKQSLRKKIKVTVKEKEQGKEKNETNKKDTAKEEKKQEIAKKEEKTESKVSISEMEKQQPEQKTAEAKPSEEPEQQEQAPVQNEEEETPQEDTDDGNSSVTYYPDETEEPEIKNDFYNSEEACRLDHSTGECLPSVGNDGTSIIGYVWKIQ